MTEEVLTLNNSTVEFDASTRIGIHDLCRADRKEPDLTPHRPHFYTSTILWDSYKMKQSSQKQPRLFGNIIKQMQGILFPLSMFDSAGIRRGYLK